MTVLFTDNDPTDSHSISVLSLNENVSVDLLGDNDELIACSYMSALFSVHVSGAECTGCQYVTY